ncbi:PPOX class probable F420-dependent enzyme [Lipingzhangella halophila]|uniref:PPOX class probable F420-dependent enzyme n=1 Tax=Lipingzhangella halophila TaxID=1783352 RepID=A0A7W7W3R5_9ACTN|nr:TIGR03668 family PPOX class F420-dependent oxidoreductase [Lipingzhangella halophila]MBB4931995.1 PPOX class probable F420-dependent enzyme [Lipingzhangella halophila]
MRWSSERTRDRFAASRVARLATVSAAGQPHLVPVTFAVYGDTVATAIDTKPKSTTNLKRLANITENPRVCLLADEYDDDWQRLWWARADGEARIVHEGPERDAALRWLTGRYPQYGQSPPDGPVILVDVYRWSGWSYQ